MRIEIFVVANRVKSKDDNNGDGLGHYRQR